MDIQEQVKLRFKGVDFPTVSLHSTEKFKEEEGRIIKSNITPYYFLPKDHANKFGIIMNVEIEAEGYFKLKVIAVGHFELSKEDIDEATRKSFINANSPAIVFPYVRSFISTLTSNVGGVTSPIILPTRFFNGELEEFVVQQNES